jgi:hypothetical protein
MLNTRHRRKKEKKGFHIHFASEVFSILFEPQWITKSSTMHLIEICL